MTGEADPDKISAACPDAYQITLPSDAAAIVFDGSRAVLYSPKGGHAALAGAVWQRLKSEEWWRWIAGEETGQHPRTMIEQRANGFTRQIIFHPGYDWRHDAPKRYDGICDVGITFTLNGELGAVEWTVNTGWLTASAGKHLERFPTSADDLKRAPSGWGLRYHSKKPLHREQKSAECTVLAGPCLSGPSPTGGDALVEGFLNGGDEWVWNRLEAYYNNMFKRADG